MESDGGFFIDKNRKHRGDDVLKCLDGNGKASDLEKTQLVRKDKVEDANGMLYGRFRPHHGAVFAAMAMAVREADVDTPPPPGLGKAATDALAVYDGFVEDLKK